MQVYLVREPGTTRLHGIFWADSRASLFWAIDEMADPRAFEFARIVRASGLWTNLRIGEPQASPQFSDEEEDFGIESEDIAPAFDQRGGDLLEAICDQASLRWQTFKDSDVPPGYEMLP